MKRTVFLLTVTVGALALIPATSAGEPVGTAITYQGSLTKNGQPVDGSADFKFTLWDAEQGGDQIGPMVPKNTVDVVEGLFTVEELDFGVDPYTENEVRWLETEVRSPAGGGEFTKLPRQKLTPTPFSLATRGLNVDAAGKVGIGTASPASLLDVRSIEGVHGVMSEVPWIPVWAHHAATTGTFPAVHGECDSEASYGSAVRGIMTSTSPGSSSAAVRGINNGTGAAGIGVHGSQDGSGYGVYGYTPDGHGVYGRSTDGTGVLGATDSNSLHASGVEGVVNDTSPGMYSAGVLGHNNGTGRFGYGVHGTQDGSGIGVYGSTPSGYGVYGTTSDGTGVYGWSIGGTGVWGRTDSVASNATGVQGFVNSTAPGAYSAGVRGHNNGTGGNGIGVWGSQDGSGWGVFGSTASGSGVYGYSSDGVGVRGHSDSGYAGYFDGTVSVKVLEIAGADLAEKFPVSEEVKPGMVVAIDPDHPGQLCLARGVYNRRVAGVVSGANGLPAGAILGHLEGAGDAPPIALSGRVWVYADATQTPIEPGDLLTTSDTAGHAMKVTDHTRAPGAVLGKAMSALKDGKGLVLVLVSLQ